ncbi:MAG: EsaB/YukD family protein, partial [Actinomycetota bacterium]|nr:EsaB/YukD family protein [Actinomycetota bacterium]
MSASRVCIQADRHGDPVMVDVLLPSNATLGELLPTIVGFVDGGALPGDTAVRWRLEHPSTGPLDPSLSLLDNGIRDGDLLILDIDGAPSLGPLRRSAPRVVTLVRPSRRMPAPVIANSLCLLATALAAVVLASAVGSVTATTSAVLAAAGMVAAAVVAVATGHPTASSVAVVILAGVTGFLAVPSGPAAPNVFLGATAALCAALLAMRLSGRASVTLVALTALSLPVAVVTLVALPATAVGAALS